VFPLVTMPRRHAHRFLAALSCGVTLAALGAAGAGAAAVPPPSGTIVRLSDERLLTRWAHPGRLTDIRRTHSALSRSVGRLRFFTEDGFPEVYLLLREYTDGRGADWVQIRVPRRPNGGVGWVPRDALGPFNVNRDRLIVNRHTLRATLLRRGRRVWSARVGIGAPGTTTPPGHFWVREKFRFKNTPVYGTHAIGTSAYAPRLTDWPGGGVVGLHGTDQPDLIPGRPSHGCIRLRNADIARLWQMLHLGTPLWIR